MTEHPERVRRRIVPSTVQVQVILGSLLGGARIEGEAGERRMRVTHAASLVDYAWWKYDRLGTLADRAPAATARGIELVTIAHPLFDDLAPLAASPARARAARDLLSPLGLAVWMADRGRLRMGPHLFVPAWRPALASPSSARSASVGMERSLVGTPGTLRIGA